jgi:phenylacetate-coenzyme A ligase PaaK-like adenylate-forming protein
MLDEYAAGLTGEVSEEDAVRAAMEWHFSPTTGSRYWLAKARELPFDPRKDIKNLDALALFPDVTEEWKAIPVDALIPQGLRRARAEFGVFESGGTTGAPKRIVERSSRREALVFVQRMMHEAGFPVGAPGDWLHLGPTGPHIVGRSIGHLAKMHDRICFAIDMDPRWVKACVKEGDRGAVSRYVDHIITQALHVLRSQKISILFATPPVLEAIVREADALKIFRESLAGIIWAGTAASEETLRLLATEAFPDARIFGLYGNTMMGIAPQRPRQEEDADSCIFQTCFPFCAIDVVDPERLDERVKYGSFGRVRVHVLTPDLLIPNTVERDFAKRVPPLRGLRGDCVAQVHSRSANSRDEIVGVY